VIAAKSVGEIREILYSAGSLPRTFSSLKVGSRVSRTSTRGATKICAVSDTIQMSGRIISDELRLNGYYCCPEICESEQILKAFNSLQQMRWRRTPLNENDQSILWDEAAIDSASELCGLVLKSSLRRQLEKEFSEIRDTVCWANRYRLGEFIPEHVDSEGDIQVILPIHLPPSQCGGGFTIFHNNRLTEVKQRLGQSIVFVATKTAHQTTVLVKGMTPEDPMRITVVCRIFFAGH